MRGITQGLQLFSGNNPYNNSAQYPARDVMDVICNRYKIQPDVLLNLSSINLSLP